MVVLMNPKVAEEQAKAQERQEEAAAKWARTLDTSPQAADDVEKFLVKLIRTWPKVYRLGDLHKLAMNANATIDKLQSVMINKAKQPELWKQRKMAVMKAIVDINENPDANVVNGTQRHTDMFRALTGPYIELYAKDVYDQGAIGNAVVSAYEGVEDLAKRASVVIKDAANKASEGMGKLAKGAAVAGGLYIAYKLAKR